MPPSTANATHAQDPEAAAPMFPLRFEPILKRLIWGGRRLGTMLHKPIGPENDYAESWEIAQHRNGQSRVADGPLAGIELAELVKQRGAEVLGPALGDRTQFPLLVKFIDARDVLSVQVHPDDTLARRLANDNGKTEAWVVLDAEPGSLIYAGLQPGVTRETFAEALQTGAVEPLLHRFEPKPGDCIHIPAGTLHAIGAGVLLAEVQQMSDATFRVFDWNRLGADGQPRPLHIAEALEATHFDSGPVNPIVPASEPIPGGVRERLACCPYFELERLRLNGSTEVGSTERFTLVLGLAGSAEIRHDGQAYRLGRGETLLLPAAVGRCEVMPAVEATVLTCVVP